MPLLGASVTDSSIYCDYTYNQRVMIRVKAAETEDGGGEYMLVAADDNIGLYNYTTRQWVGQLSW